MDERTIMLVEDDERQVELAMLALHRHGIVAEVDEVVVAGDGEEALEYLLGEGDHAGRYAKKMPEFVLLYVNLPKRDGLDVLEKLREDERTELLPIILFSSSKEREQVVEGYRLGANSYVAKPERFAEFSEAMKYLGWYWLNFNESP
ncbi:MAG: response regulator [Rubrobacteraceae bacterium]